MSEEAGKTSEARVPAVYDCMVYFQAAFNGYGPAAACLEAAADGRVRLFASEAVLAEVEDVLGRPEVRRKRRHLTPSFLNAFMDRVRRIATIIHHASRHFSYERDRAEATAHPVY